MKQSNPIETWQYVAWPLLAVIILIVLYWLYRCAVSFFNNIEDGQEEYSAERWLGDGHENDKI